MRTHVRLKDFIGILIIVSFRSLIQVKLRIINLYFYGGGVYGDEFSIISLLIVFNLIMPVYL